MCLILLAWRTPLAHRLVVAANRDEFHGRPAAPAAFWHDQPQILAGRDLQAGGTWMGVSRGGRFAAVTNYRGAREPSAAHSRGALVSRFLAGDEPAGAYLQRIEPAAYSGFNLLVCDGEELWALSNRDGPARRLGPGTYGLGNTLLDAPEVHGIKQRFSDALSGGIAVEPLFSVLGAAHLVNPSYGTRCATVHFGRRYAERSFDRDGGALDTLHYEF